MPSHTLNLLSVPSQLLAYFLSAPVLVFDKSFFLCPPMPFDSCWAFLHPIVRWRKALTFTLHPMPYLGFILESLDFKERHISSFFMGAAPRGGPQQLWHFSLNCFHFLKWSIYPFFSKVPSDALSGYLIYPSNLLVNS